MTIRGILLGLCGAVIICSVTYFNDAVMHQTQLTGNNFPFSVYGALILFMLAANPLLAKLRKRWSLSGQELAVALTLTLAAASIPGSSLLRSFTGTLMIPHQAVLTDPGWKAEGVVEMVPPEMLPDVTRDGSVAVNGFVQGLSLVGKPISVTEVPWHAWARTLAFWVPLILMLWIALVGLAVVVHRQWAKNEHLSYPIAQFADALLPADGEPNGSVFRNKMFWYATLAVLAIHATNYLQAWWPGMISIPLSIDFRPLGEYFTTLERGGAAGRLLNPHVYFTVVAIAYFLASDVSLSVAVGPWAYCYMVGLLTGYGVSFGGDYYEVTPRNTVQAGAYIGVLAMILYTGRRYYITVFKKAVMLKTEDEAAESAVWGARVFGVCAALFAIDLIWVGLDWPLALAYTVLIIGIFLVLSRMLVETGLFHMNPFWSPGVLMVSMLGIRTVGPEAALILFLLSSVLLIEPRGALMPFMVDSLGLLEKRGVKPGRPAMLAVGAVILGLAIALPLTLYFQYDYGADLSDEWANRWIPRLGFRQGLSIKQTLEAQGTLGGGWIDRLSSISPDGTGTAFFSLGLVMVLAVSVARLRLPWWPIHPVLFLVWTTGHAQGLAASFLLGWLLKSVIMKYGGIMTYRRLRPLMFGLIAGEMLAGVCMSIIGALWYLITGEVPASHAVMMG